MKTALYAMLLSACLSSFRAGAQAPYVLNALPAANANATPAATDVALLFSQAINPATATGLTVHSARFGGKRGGLVAANGAQVSLFPYYDFLPGEVVSVTVPASITDLSGTAAVPRVYRFAVAAQGGTGVFSGGSDVSVGNNPGSVAAADVDSDGDLDLLAGNISANTVSLRLNDGTGAFGPSPWADIAVGQEPFWLATADVDGDGDVDLLTANYGTNGVSINLNDGRGNFGTGTRVGVGQYPRELAVADLDGDGDLDFVTANAGSNSLSVRYNNGAGVFSPGVGPTGQDVPVGVWPYSVAVGDVDGDGDGDLLASNHDSHTVSVRLNDGHGSFGGGSEVPVGLVPYGLATADVDSDGDLDFLVANQGTSTVSVRLNNGQGVFGGGSDPGVAPSAVYIAVADVDGDGDVDLLTSSAYMHNTVSVRLNNGLGIFGGGSDALVGINPGNLTTADLDGDGDLDLLTSAVNPLGTVSVRFNQSAVLLRANLLPASGPVGTAVTLTGPDFTGASAVSFNGARVPAGAFTVTSPTTLRVVVPGRATTGLVRVTTPRGVTASNLAFAVTPTATATNPGRALAAVAIYPNPANDYATVWLPTSLQPTTLRLVDALGRVLQTVPVPAGAAGPTTLKLHELRTGLYALHISSDGQTVVRRLVRE